MRKSYTNSKFDSISYNKICFILTITFLIIVNISSPAAAQQKVLEIEKYISEYKGAQDAQNLKSLIFDAHPTVYINEGAFEPKGEGTMAVANVSAGDMVKLQEGHPSLRSVKLLLITFKDLQELQAFRLQPTSIGSMPNLAYVFLSLGFDAAPAEIFSGIQGFDGSEIIFLYESARPF